MAKLADKNLIKNHFLRKIPFRGPKAWSQQTYRCRLRSKRQIGHAVERSCDSHPTLLSLIESFQNCVRLIVKNRRATRTPSFCRRVRARSRVLNASRGSIPPTTSFRGTSKALNQRMAKLGDFDRYNESLHIWTS